MAKVKKRGRGRPRRPGVWVRLDLEVPKAMARVLRSQAKVTGQSMRGLLLSILERHEAATRVDPVLTAISCAYQDPIGFAAERGKAGAK